MSELLDGANSVTVWDRTLQWDPRELKGRGRRQFVLCLLAVANRDSDLVVPDPSGRDKAVRLLEAAVRTIAAGVIYAFDRQREPVPQDFFFQEEVPPWTR